MKITTAQNRKTHINLTALIDILFLLIIFFSVSTRFTNQQAIGIDLPKTQTSSAVSTESKLIIIMDNDNRFFLNGQLMDWKQAGEEIKSERFDRTQKVILNIDQRVTHGKVVNLLDLLKLNQFKRVVFGTYGKQ